jgi:hypothetical protein
MMWKKSAIGALVGVMVWLLSSRVVVPDAVANDAFVLPKGVFRLTSGTSFLTATESYGDTGEKSALGAMLGATVQALIPALHPTSQVEVSITRQDLAFDYGLTNALSLSMQLPMYLHARAQVTKNQDMDTALRILNTAGAPTAGRGKLGELFQKLSQDGSKAGTFGDLLVGAKYQFLHSGSSFRRYEAGTYRAAVAFGAKLPTGSLASPDTNDIPTTTAANTKSFILGARTYFDYQFATFFYLNFYTEHEYRFAGPSKSLFTHPQTLSYQVLNVQYQPGFYNHLELDFTFTPTLVDHLFSESGLRITGDFTTAGQYTAVPVGQEALLSQAGTSSRAYTLSPYVGVFYTGAPLPLKFKVITYLPLGGKNSYVVKGFSGILYVYLRF